MYLKDLTKVTEIDQRIAAKHREIAELYQEKLVLMNAPDGSMTTYSGLSTEGLTATATDTHMSLAEQWYHQAVSAWEKHGVKIPSYSTLRAKFTRAEKKLKLIAESCPEISSEMIAIVVPPVKVMPFPANELRNNQGLTSYEDYVHHAIASPIKQRNWRVLLTYAAPDSIFIGSPKQMLKDKSYILAGFDMRDLGLREYSALSLQADYLLDEVSWTALLKDYKKNRPITYVGYMQGRYRFEIEDADNILDDDGFRPTIEV